MSSESAEGLDYYVYKPKAFVEDFYPWKEGLLLNETGPDTWQAEILDIIGDQLEFNDSATKIAVASGHGIGKTTLISWVIQFFIATRPHPQIVVTSNTATQLNTKTWRELSKWHKMLRVNDLFEWTATKYCMKAHSGTWAAHAIPWSKDRSEAFAGTHEEHVLLLFDEASLIDDSIWEVAEGAMTTPGSVWLAFGNPTRNTGRFRECFGKFRHRWITKQIDSRTAKKTDKKLIDQWIEDYGEDSDFVRVRVKGQFPRASSNQFIPEDLIDRAMARELFAADYDFAPIIVGIDPARFGDDRSVIYVRQGLATLLVKKYRNIDTMQLAAFAAETIDMFDADAVFVDEIGIGAGVVDRLKQLGYACIGVNSGIAAINDKQYFNKRAEMWALLLEWLVAGGLIPNDQELRDDLIGPEYGYDAKNRTQLEKKDDMKDRGLASPDVADALALTFAYPVSAKARKRRKAIGMSNWNKRAKR